MNSHSGLTAVTVHIRIGEKRGICMKRQLQGIAVILMSILLMLGYGNAPFFDLDFRWGLIFSIIGMAGLRMTFLPDDKK